MSKPERVFRIGSVSASVFKNEPNEGRSFRSVVLQRSYQDSGDRKYTNNFTLSDRPHSCHLNALDSVGRSSCGPCRRPLVSPAKQAQEPNSVTPINSDFRRPQ